MQTLTQVFHRTMGDTRLGRTLSGSLEVAKAQAWIWPLVVALGLGILGWSVQLWIESAAKSQLAEQLEAIRDANVYALRLWFNVQKTTASDIAADPQVRDPAATWLQQASSLTSRNQLLAAPDVEALRSRLGPVLVRRHYDGFLLFDSAGRVVAADNDEPVGDSAPESFRIFLKSVVDSGPAITRPYLSWYRLPDHQKRLNTGVPIMYAAAPINDADGKIAGILAFSMRPEGEFSNILASAQAGKSGETYAFDRGGLFLSNSRFDDQLMRIGLIPDRSGSASILNLEVRDPQVDLINGNDRPNKRRSEQSLTVMAKSAVSGETGVNAGGYRNYCGVPVVGAWVWLPEYDLGIATEIDTAEAERSLVVLRRACGVLFALLIVCALVIMGFTIVTTRMHAAARKAALSAKVLGQYQLEEKIGEGGMGAVYRGRHVLIRRPTAIKVLSDQNSSRTAIARFEREVNLTCRLNHPNTVSVFDYGRTPAGLFFYAMEYVDGVTFESLVQRHGPQPSGRAVHLLRQVCGSLVEAHELGLVHRDIKPANLMLCRRAGIDDFVKVLDFGLARAVDRSQEAKLTIVGTVTGTPLFMSPEALQTPDQVDARTDLYSLGVVAYYLLTGTTPIEGSSVVEICLKQVSAEFDSPSKRLGRPVPEDLEGIVMRCLAKKPEERYASAREVMQALSRCTCAAEWGDEQARQWWGDPENQPPKAPPPSPPSTKARAIDATYIFEPQIEARN